MLHHSATPMSEIFSSISVEIPTFLVILAICVTVAIVALSVLLVAIDVTYEKRISLSDGVTLVGSIACFVLIICNIVSPPSPSNDGNLQNELKSGVENHIDLDGITLKAITDSPNSDSKTEFVGSGTNSEGHKQDFTYTQYSDFGVIKPVTEGENQNGEVSTTAPTDKPTSQTN